VSHGGLAVTLAEMVTPDAGVSVTVADEIALFDETPGRVVVETSDPDAVRERVSGVASVERLGASTPDGRLRVDVGEDTLERTATEISSLRDVIDRELD
jgi:phosphoribosylformylglycinamidine synthase